MSKGDYWYSILYWKLKAATRKNIALSRLLENMRLECAIRGDPLLKLIKSQVGDHRGVIYDVGAHVGNYSVVLGRHVDDCLIYSFEPNLQSYLKLTENIKLMKLEDKIIPKNIALGSCRAKVRLYISSASGRTSLDRQHAESDGNEVVGASIVDCYTIDDLVSNGVCKPPDVVKIDVEGHEYEVIKGAENTIASKRPWIFFEPHESGEEQRIKAFLATNFDYTCKSLGCSIWCYRGGS